VADYCPFLQPDEQEIRPFAAAVNIQFELADGINSGQDSWTISPISIIAPGSLRAEDTTGKYRFGEDCRGGEISVTRQGNQLYETWGADKPVEILPRKFDTFFTPGFPMLERFVRDRRGRVVGILYMLGDSEVEAKRVQ
jgi:hypothetical protein